MNANVYDEIGQSQRFFRMDARSKISHALGMEKGIGSRLKELRTDAGLSVREVAREMDIPNSTYSSYEDKFKKPFLPMEFAKRLAEVLERRGVKRNDVMALAGVQDAPNAGMAEASRLFVHGAGEPRMAAVEELDVSASAGEGANVEGAEVVRTWLMPRDVVSIATESAIDGVKIVRVKGDSMVPTYNALDRILVDTGDTLPSPGGVFIVWDGLGLVVKRVQVVAHSDPVRVRITSDNAKYDPYERMLGEAYIQGRVIGKWIWT